MQAKDIAPPIDAIVETITIPFDFGYILQSYLSLSNTLPSIDSVSTVLCWVSKPTSGPYGALSATVINGGLNYVVGDVLTGVGGTYNDPTVFTVATVGVGGTITSLTLNIGGSYSVVPDNPVVMSGGTGTGCTLYINWNPASDPNPMSRIIGTSQIVVSPKTQIVNGAVLQQFGNMVAGITYGLLVAVTLSNGDTPDLWTHLQCTSTN